jgi:outer membrane immunogenic protein
MRKFLLGSVAFFGLTAAASAADYRPAPMMAAPVFTWTGFYIGANAGGIWSDGNIRPLCSDDGVPFGNTDCIVPLVPSASPESSSWLAGAQVGYNYQYRNWVFGAEVDLQATDLSRTNNQLNPAVTLTNQPFVGPAFAALTYRGRAEIDWFGTARGRIGVAWDRVLIYGTGGVMFANVTTSHFQDRVFVPGTTAIPPPSTLTGIASHDSIVPGFVVGGGLEYAFANNWSLKVEGLYYELQKSHAGNREFSNLNFNGPTFGVVSQTEVDHNGFIVRGGINYRFSGP